MVVPAVMVAKFPVWSMLWKAASTESSSRTSGNVPGDWLIPVSHHPQTTPHSQCFPPALLLHRQETTCAAIRAQAWDLAAHKHHCKLQNIFGGCKTAAQSGPVVFSPKQQTLGIFFISELHSWCTVQCSLDKESMEEHIPKSQTSTLRSFFGHYELPVGAGLAGERMGRAKVHYQFSTPSIWLIKISN